MELDPKLPVQLRRQVEAEEVPEEYIEDMYTFSVDNTIPDTIGGILRKYGIQKNQLQIDQLDLLHEDWSEGDKEEKTVAQQIIARATLVLLNCMRDASGLPLSMQDPNQWTPKELAGNRRTKGNLGNKMTISKSVPSEELNMEEAAHAAPGVTFRLVVFGENMFYILQAAHFFDPEMRDLTAPNLETQPEFRAKIAARRAKSVHHAKGQEILAYVNENLGMKTPVLA